MDCEEVWKLFHQSNHLFDSKWSATQHRLNFLRGKTPKLSPISYTFLNLIKKHKSLILIQPTSERRDQLKPETK